MNKARSRPKKFTQVRVFCVYRSMWIDTPNPMTETEANNFALQKYGKKPEKMR